MRPKVDIIIPFHGRYELVSRCLGSIFSCTPNQEYNIYLVDDCSPNKEYLSRLSSINHRIKPIRLDKHSGFGTALAKGFVAGKGENVIFMHSDVYVDNINWLANMQRAYGKLKSERVKLVCARTNSVGTSNSVNEKMIGSPTDETGDVISESPLPLQCALCHRELFYRIGGFIKSYPYAWYEDEELFYRMRYYGFKQAIVGNSFVWHDGGATINDLYIGDIKETMDNNRNLCLGDIRPFLRNR